MFNLFSAFKKVAGKKRTETVENYFSDEDIELIKRGEHYRLHDKFGAHPMVYKERKGAYFCVYAPFARKVSVIGDFNQWNNNQLLRRADCPAVWEGFILNVKKGDMYKFVMKTLKSIRKIDKADPFAYFSEGGVGTASIVWEDYYAWADSDWLNKRKEWDFMNSPISVYEVHLGSWKRNKSDKNSTANEAFKSYRDLAEQLVEYVKDMGFTHIELMPIAEHPFYGSWGYQSLGLYSPTSRYGDPQDLKYLIDRFHQKGIGVILDWVPSHFPADSHGLANFDGSKLYELEEFHPEWNSSLFDLGSKWVNEFLISNALFWINNFHIDGLRVDAVASMLYLDYARGPGQWSPNIYGGNENLEAVAFLIKLNNEVRKRHPDVLLIAEESSAWPAVSRPMKSGGLGFDLKWNMGWMHDTLKYFNYEPAKRIEKNSELTFSLIYAFNENFMLALSHDEVVYGKKSLLAKMPGTDHEKFAHLKCLYGFMYAHPGKKLMFMGNEIAQWKEWNHDEELDWGLLNYKPHQQIKEWLNDLNILYKNQRALYEADFDQGGFQWVSLGDNFDGVFSFIRKDKQGGELILVACNFDAKKKENHIITMEHKFQWELLLDSNDGKYGGSQKECFLQLITEPLKEDLFNGKAKFRYFIDLEPLSVQFFKNSKDVRKNE